MEITDERNRHISIEITPVHEALVSAMKDTMETKVSARCIARVKEEISRGHENLYTPNKVSIGPLHHGSKASLKDMEDHKWRYLYALLNRKPNLEARLDTCVAAMKELENKARLCYEEKIDLSSDDFVKMMLVDGGFIIELFLKHAVKGLKRRNDIIFSMPGLLFDLRCDLILLENQIPFFILQRLYQIVPIPEQCKQSLTSLAFHFFRNMIPGDPRLHKEKFSLEGNHLLDLIRHCFLPTIPRVKAKLDAPVSLQSAKKLKEAGIRFKKAKTENLLDIKFVDGVLEIPPIIVHQYTESLLRNLVAFEQCPCDNTLHISSYVVLMKSLICNERDVKFLKRRDILINYDANEKDTSKLFEKLSSTVTNLRDLAKDFCFDGLCEQVNGYKATTWRRVVSKKKNAPLARTTLFVVAILLLVLTFVGTLFSVLSFFLHH